VLILRSEHLLLAIAAIATGRSICGLPICCFPMRCAPSAKRFSAVIVMALCAISLTTRGDTLLSMQL